MNNGFLSSVFKPLGNLLGAVFKPLTKLLKNWLAPEEQDKEGLKLQRVGSNIAIPVVYGERITGGIVVDKNVTDGEIIYKNGQATVSLDGSKNALLHYLVVFSYGEIESFEEIYFNDIESTDDRYKKDNGKPWFAIETRLGGDDNLTAVNGVGKLNKFSTANSKYEGLAIALITFEQDKNQTVWRGEPEITAKIKGKKCYDWRTGVTGYTENPALHAVDYLKSNIYSIGLQDSEINYPYATQVADLCDTENGSNVVTTSKGYYDKTLKKYVETGSVTTEETFKLLLTILLWTQTRNVF